MFILDLPDIYATCDKVCFVNPSGLVELWVTKNRLSRYRDNDRLLQYLRRKLGDKTIHKIIPYETDSYLIIRHPLQDVNKFIESYKKYIDNGGCSRWCRRWCEDYGEDDFICKHITFFNNLDFVVEFCRKYWDKYILMPIRFKCNKKLLVAVLIKDQKLFQYMPNFVKRNRDLVMYLIRASNRDNKSNYIYQYLTYKLRKDPKILSISLNNGSYNDIMHNIVDYIPDNLINNREFILSLNINKPSNLYQFLNLNMQRDYDIILKIGYFDNQDEYHKIMKSVIKSDIVHHRK